MDLEGLIMIETASSHALARRVLASPHSRSKVVWWMHGLLYELHKYVVNNDNSVTMWWVPMP